MNRTLWLLVALFCLPMLGQAEEENDLAQHYGFKKVELFKLQQRSANLVAADLNNDGRTDLIIVDNSNSRLDILKQRLKPDESAKPVGKINDIRSDWRFEHQKVAVDKAVSSLAVGDFNGDKKTDIVYFAVPDQLTVRLQGDDGEWGVRDRLRLPDVQPSMWIVAAGDLNSDKRDDIVVLGKLATYVIYQQADGELAPPIKLMNTSENLGLAQINDLDGDGRNDLCYQGGDDAEHPFAVRLQTADGKLGPELRCEMPQPRGVTVANVDGKPGAEVLFIEGQTGRVKIHQLQRPEQVPGELAAQLIQYGFGTQSGKGRDLAVGDINGDKLQDVVVTDPEGAQVIVYLQTPGAGLVQAEVFPSLDGAEQIRVADLDGDKKAEVVVLSPREKSIGVSRMEGARLTFPITMTTDKEPVCLEVADLNADGKLEIVYVARDRTASTTKYVLQALSAVGGGWKPYKFGEEVGLAFTIKGTPEKLLALDFNGDGRQDFLVLLEGKPPVYLQSTAEGKFVEASTTESSGMSTVSPGSLFVGMLDKPALLVAQSNFARRLEFQNGQWKVADQYNAAESQAKIACAATIDLDGQPGNEIVLVDLGVKKLRVLRNEKNLFKPWREVDIGAFPYKGTIVADLNGDGRDDLLLFGAGKFGVLYAGQSDPRLKQIASFETKLEHVRFSDVVAGDLNHDGQTDLAVIDTQSQNLEILDYQPGGILRHALRFQIFEAKSIAGEDHQGTDPREAVIADVTGDGRSDLILLSHDRVLVYPQDDGPTP